MPLKDPDAPTRKSRPSYFWWLLINLLALAFAVTSWTTCYFLFNFPERPSNYNILQRIDRLPALTFFERKNLPKADTIDPEQIYDQYDLEALKAANPKTSPVKALTALNTRLKRNYLTNFKRPANLRYLSGTYRILSIRRLTQDDFVPFGFVLLCQALVTPESQLDSTNPELLPYPVELEIILPTSPSVQIPPETAITEDNNFTLNKLPHALALLHVSRTGSIDEPITRITGIPLTDSSFELTKNVALPLTIPDLLNPGATFPLVKTPPPSR